MDQKKSNGNRRYAIFTAFVAVGCAVFIAVTAWSLYRDRDLLTPSQDSSGYSYQYEYLVGTVADKETETVPDGNMLIPYAGIASYGFAIGSSPTSTEYKIKILLPDGNMLIVEDKELFDSCRIGEERKIEIERKYQGEDLLSTTYKVGSKHGTPTMK